MGKKTRSRSSGGVIFVKSFRHWRTGKIVYPVKGTCIAIRIRRKK